MQEIETENFDQESNEAVLGLDRFEDNLLNKIQQQQKELFDIGFLAHESSQE